jgi:NitT/TauT family transport system substrate-binding protein
MLVVQPDMPVNDWPSFVAHVKRSPKPLKIGYKAPVAVAKLIFMRALKAEGISYRVLGIEGGEGETQGGTVELVNLQGGQNMVPSLSSGAVDGFVMNQPQVSMAKVKRIGKVIAALADLPPAGKWKDHPCCCIVAPERVIAAHRPALKALMKLTLLATAMINADKTRAAELAATWTKVPLEVERDSVPSIVYLGEFTDSWRRGMIVWADMMNEIGKFTKELKGKTGDAFLRITCDTSLIEEAAKELRNTGHLK